MNILHLGTYNCQCGIADYLKAYITALNEKGQKNEVYTIDLDRQKSSNFKEVVDFYNDFIKYCENFDVIHIQHEYGFFTGKYPIWKSFSLFHNILRSLKHDNIFVTFHSPPIPFIHSKIMHKFLKRHNWSEFFKKDENCTALINNELMRKQYSNSGFENLVKIFHPVDNVLDRNLKIDDDLKKIIINNLNIENNNYIMGLTGFITRLKGYDDIISILSNLPSNYKLILLGGELPHGRKSIYKKLLKDIKKYGLDDRVLITGYYEEEDLLTYVSLIDLFVAPYSNKFLGASGAINIGFQSGKPTLAYDIESFKEVNSEFKPLYLAEYRNKKDFKNKIIEISKNERLRDYYVNQSKLYVENNSYSKLADFCLKLYKS